MEKFQGKYRIPSSRLQNRDYASRGMYFVTICTQNRTHFFGHIIKPAADSRHFEMNLSEIGIAVESEWIKTPGLRPDMNLTLGEYQVMPNHFHAILIIGENQFNTTGQTKMVRPHSILLKPICLLPQDLTFLLRNQDPNQIHNSFRHWRII